MVGVAVDAKGNTVISADEDVTISGAHYDTLDYHNTTKKGAMGLSNKTKGAAQTNSNVKNSEIQNGGNLSLLSGNNLTLAATNVVVDGNIDLQVVDQLLITADEAVANSENWNKKAGFFSGDSLYKKTEHKDGEGFTQAQASSINAQGTITGRVGAGKIVGSEVDGQQGVDIISDAGDLEVTTARDSPSLYFG